MLKYQFKLQAIVAFVKDVDEVADVTQAFIKAYRALPNFRGESQFYTWLYRIAVNTAKNHLVSKSRAQQPLILILVMLRIVQSVIA